MSSRSRRKIRSHRAFVQCIIFSITISNMDGSSFMDLDEIRTFVTIARERSFSGAAVTLGRSQPAISRRIELLESELGAKLFERLRAGVRLTDAGSALLPHAEAMLANAKDGAA